MAVLGEEAGRRRRLGRAVEEMGGRRDEVVVTGAAHPDLHRRSARVAAGRAWSAIHAITGCRGSRPQATARLSAGPALRPVPASRAICTLAGKTAARVATLAAAAQRVRRTSPAAQTSSATPLA